MTKTKERPILFSGEMVRAILAGRKTQTRRAVKGVEDCQHIDALDDGWRFTLSDGSGGNQCNDLACPYGRPGDLLWVREPWKCCAWQDGEPEDIQYRADGTVHEISCTDSLDYENWSERMSWDGCADLEKAGWELDEDDVYRHREPHRDGKNDIRWRPSIHMPRWASRITLKVVNVRVERLQDISDADCVAEGVDILCDFDPECGALGAFKGLWESINGNGSWAANPWVWVVEFKRADTSGRAT